MEILEIETGPGDNIIKVFQKVTDYLIKNPHLTIIFKFNDLLFTIQHFYDIPDIWVEYRFCYLMGWKTIGPELREMNSEMLLRIAQAKKKQEIMMENAN